MKKKSPFFKYVSQNVEHQKSLEIINSLNLTDSNKKLLTAITRIPQDQQISIEDLITYLETTYKKTFSINSIRSYTSRLANQGIICKVTQDESNHIGRPRSIYILDIKKLDGVNSNTERQQSLCLTSNDDSHDEYHCAHRPALQNSNKIVIDDFWCQFISTILPFSNRKDVKHISGEVRFRRHQIPVEVSTRDDGKIPTIRSLRVVMAILSIVESSIKSSVDSEKDSRNSQNQFVINLRELMKLMGIENTGNNRQLILRDIQSWEDTIFRFGNITEVAQRDLESRFQNQVKQFKNYQLISQLRGLSSLKPGQKTHTIIGFELPNDLVQRIADTSIYNLFKVTPGIIKEKNTLAIALHMYCRKMIGHKTYTFDISIKRLWEHIGQSTEYSQFKKKFIALIKNRSILSNPKLIEQLEIETQLVIKQSQENKALIHGYYIHIHSNETHITITTDPSDPYVGSMSKHKKLKSEKIGEDKAPKNIKSRVKFP